MATIAVATIVRRRVPPPKLALLPVTATPRSGLLLSTLLHIAMVALLMWLPVMFPAWAMNVTSTAADPDREVVYQPLFLPTLPRIAEAGPAAKIEHESGQRARSVVETLPGGTRQTSNRPKPDYAGAQEIVSNSSDSNNGVQTIRRPDLV